MLEPFIYFNLASSENYTNISLFDHNSESYGVQ